MPEAVASPQAMEHTCLRTPTALGTLHRLPQELRLKVYRELLLDGSVQLLRSSKAIHGEAIEILLKEVVCRLEFNAYKPLDIYPSSYHSRNTMMNMEIRLVLNHSCRSYEANRRCINNFNDWMTAFRSYTCKDLIGPEPRFEDTPRKSCKILIDGDKNFLPHLPRETLSLIRFLNGFAVLTITIADDYPLEPRVRIDDRLDDPEPDPFRRMESALHSHPSQAVIIAYNHAEKFLEPYLGGGQLVSDEKGAHLEFHPRHYDIVEVDEQSTSGAGRLVRDGGKRYLMAHAREIDLSEVNEEICVRYRQNKEAQYEWRLSSKGPKS